LCKERREPGESAIQDASITVRKSGKEGSEMKALRVVLFALLLTSFARAQQTWLKTYGGTGQDQGYAVRQTLDGGYIIAGFTQSFGAGATDVYLIKTNASGDTLWTRTYGGTRGDWGFSVQQTSDGGYIVTGLTTSFGDTTNGDVYLIRTDASGDTLWTRNYGGVDDDRGNAVQQTSDSGYIVVGYTHSFGAGDYDVYLIKTNASGDTLWTRTYGGTDADWGFSVQQTLDGGYVVAGYAVSLGSDDVYLIKTNASGDTLWTRTYGGAGIDWGYAVRQTLDGGYMVAAFTYSFGAGGADVYLIKTDASGDTLWTRTFGGPGVDFGYSGQQTSDGGYVVAGYTSSFGAGFYDVYLIKADASGDTLWTRTYGGTSFDQGRSMQETSDGGYVIAGLTSSFGAGSDDVYLVKTDADGNAGVEERQIPDAGRVTPEATIIRGALFLPASSALLDLSGHKVMGLTPGANDVSSIAPGVYFVRTASGVYKVVLAK
jgi:hypothetical protein